MNKLTVHVPSLPDLSAVASTHMLNPRRPRHLIVLIPPDSDYTSVTRRICKLAEETDSTIQLLGLCKNQAQELALRRELVTVAALIQYAKVFAETKVEVGVSWLEAVKCNYQEGDTIVCITELPVGIRRRPLSEILESTLKAPIYILSETIPSQTYSNIPSLTIAWLGFLAIIAGFLLLQVKIVQFSKDWFQAVMLILLLVPEFGALWLWNSLFS